MTARRDNANSLIIIEERRKKIRAAKPTYFSIEKRVKDLERMFDEIKGLLQQAYVRNAHRHYDVERRVDLFNSQIHNWEQSQSLLHWKVKRIIEILDLGSKLLPTQT